MDSPICLISQLDLFVSGLKSELVLWLLKQKDLRKNVVLLHQPHGIHLD